VNMAVASTTLSQFLGLLGPTALQTMCLTMQTYMITPATASTTSTTHFERLDTNRFSRRVQIMSVQISPLSRDWPSTHNLQYNLGLCTSQICLPSLIKSSLWKEQCCQGHSRLDPCLNQHLGLRFDQRFANGRFIPFSYCTLSPSLMYINPSRCTVSSSSIHLLS
jgi:hypothetical protein